MPARASTPRLALPRSALPVLLVASAVLSLCMGLRQSLGLFLRPMNADIGVSASTFGLAMAVQSLVWGLAQPVVGAAADRWGPRPVLFASSLVYVAGLAVMALSGSPLVGLPLGGGLLIGLGVAGTGFGVLIGAVSRATPPERRSWTVGLVSAAGSLGTMLLAPLGQQLIEGLGWRGALLCFAGVAAAMALLSLGIGGGRDRDVGAAAVAGDGQGLRDALAEAFAHRGYLALTAAFFACGFQLVFIGTHLPRYLALCGLPPSVGASALALIGLFNAAGSLAAGWLGTRYDRSRLLALVYLLRTLAIAAYLALPVSAPSTLVFAAAMGLLWLSVTPLVSGLIGGLFGLRHFNALFGVVFLSHQLGSFAGAWLGGLALDLTGSYRLAWWSMIAVGLTAAALQWPMDTRPAPKAAAAA